MELQEKVWSIHPGAVTILGTGFSFYLIVNSGMTEYSKVMFASVSEANITMSEEVTRLRKKHGIENKE